MEVRNVHIELLGTSFFIQTDESKEYVDSLIQHIKTKLDIIKQTSNVGDPFKSLVLASLFIADELFNEKKLLESKKTLEPYIDVGAVADRLIARIDDLLEN
jgi:cell division protein ZapA